MRNHIPIARGLGSSAAATVAGVVAANALLGGPLDTPTQLRIAAGIEGHPDNAAAALLGGFVASAATADGVEAIRVDVTRDLRAVLFIPERRLPTDAMRKALPSTIPLEDAVGDEVETSRPVAFAREEPAYGGPVAGLMAGRQALDRAPDLLLVLAVDMPFVTSATVERLVAAAGQGDGAVLTSADGRRRLVLVVRTARLDQVAPVDPHGCPVHVLLTPLDLRGVPATGREGYGIDTVEDLQGLQSDGSGGSGVAASGKSREPW
jgi:CTP:molybdopterin cytidylyltransferase MocA